MDSDAWPCSRFDVLAAGEFMDAFHDLVDNIEGLCIGLRAVIEMRVGG